MPRCPHCDSPMGNLSGRVICKSCEDNAFGGTHQLRRLKPEGEESMVSREGAEMILAEMQKRGRILLKELDEARARLEIERALADRLAGALTASHTASCLWHIAGTCDCGKTAERTAALAAYDEARNEANEANRAPDAGHPRIGLPES